MTNVKPHRCPTCRDDCNCGLNLVECKSCTDCQAYAVQLSESVDTDGLDSLLLATNNQQRTTNKPLCTTYTK